MEFFLWESVFARIQIEIAYSSHHDSWVTGRIQVTRGNEKSIRSYVCPETNIPKTFLLFTMNNNLEEAGTDGLYFIIVNRERVYFTKY